MDFLKGNPHPAVTGADETSGRTNYLLGRDPARWVTQVPNYSKVRYHNVYAGIDLVYYGNQRQIEHDFLVAPGSDPSQIQLAFAGARAVRVDENGNLVLRTGTGDVDFLKPVAYQAADPKGDDSEGRRTIIPARYVMGHGNQVRFALSAYDRSRTLVIDPVLVYSTYLGGSTFDEAQAIAVDSSGNTYLTGNTTSTDFPHSAGTFQSACKIGGMPPTCSDAFVTKFSASGASLLYSTYLGGSLTEVGEGIAVDSSGDAYVTGVTTSPDFPTMNAFQVHCGGFDMMTNTCPQEDAFLTKLNPGGSALLYSTYLGGAGADEANGIAIDSSGNAYIAGLTQSTDFPTSAGAFQTQCGTDGTCNGGFSDAFVAKISTTASGPASLVYSTYLGGSGSDFGNGIAIDSSGNAYVTGSTTSVSDFPGVSGHFQTGCKLAGSVCNGNAFVTKLNSAGTGLLYSTYLGGNGESVSGTGFVGDFGKAIAVDSSGDAYVAGQTASSNFPVTAGAFQTKCGTDGNCNATGGISLADGFVTKFNSTGTALVYSTYLGGSGSDSASGIAFGLSGTVYVSGSTNSAERTDIHFPATSNAIQSAPGGGTCSGVPCDDVFVSELDATGAGLIFSTYLGGNDADEGTDIAADSSGNAYVAGSSHSANFPTMNPVSGACVGTCGDGSHEDAFAAELGGVTGPFASLSPLTLFFGYESVGALSSARPVTLTNTGSASLSVSSVSLTGTNSTEFGQTNNCLGPLAPGANCTVNVTFTPAAGGIRSAAVTVTDTSLSSPQTVPVSGVGSYGPTETVDFDGNGKADFTVFRPDNGTWYVNPSNGGATSTKLLGQAGDVEVAGDYDGDGKADVAVWRPSTGTWYVILSSTGATVTTVWGIPGDVPVPGDYDGDGKTDYAVWRPSNGTWYVIPSSNPTQPITTVWGVAGDIPVVGDYDGDGKWDYAVWRPSTFTWYIIPSGNPANTTKTAWGAPGDIPVEGDYDGDGKTDLAVWRPSNGTWYIIPSGGGPTIKKVWGVPGDIPVTGDYDGDRKNDFAVWRPDASEWFILNSSNGSTTTKVWGVPGDIPATHLALVDQRNRHVANFDGDREADIATWTPSTGVWKAIPSSNPTGPQITATWGVPGDILVPGDYDGDGKTDFAVWRPSTGTWFVIPSSNPSLQLQTVWGVKGDIPVPGDYDGDGKTDYAVWRPSNGTWYIIPSSSPTTQTTFVWGVKGDIPVPGDYDGDGKTDYAVWRPSNGTWYIIPSSSPTTQTTFVWGVNGDMPVPGDYDGDGKSDYAIWRPSSGTWYVVPSSKPTTQIKTVWGVTGDIPVPKDYDGDEKTDYAIWRPSTGQWYILKSTGGQSVTVLGASTDVPVQKPTGQ